MVNRLERSFPRDHYFPCFNIQPIIDRKDTLDSFLKFQLARVALQAGAFRQQAV